MINNDLNKIKKDIRRAMDDTLKQTSIDINFIIEQMYEQAIEKFYNSYKPRYYRRTYSTYYASDLFDSDKIFNPEKVGNSYMGGITVTSDNIKGDPYNRDGKALPNKTEWVFNRTYVKGIHGVSQIEKRSWGKNTYWDRYRRIVNGRKSKYMLNQYNSIKEIGGRYATEIDAKQLNKLNNELRKIHNSGGTFGEMHFSKGDGEFIDYKSMKAMNLEIINWARGQMTGKKPAQIMQSNYTKLRQSQTINEIMFKNLYNQLLRLY